MIHTLTGGQWTAILFGAAAVTAVLALTPPLSWLVKPVGTYLGLWLGFNLARAYADDTGWADRVLGLVSRLEAWLGGGRLPSAVLQERFYDAGNLDQWDYGLTLVYLSFFVVPYVVAILLLWKNRRLFWRYVLATTMLFVLALVGFYAIPASPPWLVTEMVPTGEFPQVLRVTEEVLASLDLPFRLFNHQDDAGMRMSKVRFEPNPIAAMPSIHFAATFLLIFPARKVGKAVFGAAILYACLMGLALVYLGEHYVLDLVAAGILTSVGWMIAGKYTGDGEQS